MAFLGVLQGGDYELTTVTEKPTCTIEGHTLSQEEEIVDDEDGRRRRDRD